MIKGIHHITAIASDAQKTIDFYSGVLGLRLVKKSVNQDDVATYHLFFGDRLGHPGMDVTFFIFQPSYPGRRGIGMVTTISFAVPADSLEWWLERFDHQNIQHEPITERFGYKRLVFFDHDNQRLELVGVTDKQLEADIDVWTTKDILQEQAIRSFFSASMSVISKTTIELILTDVFGYEPIVTERNMHLYTLKDSTRANILEVHEEPSLEPGLNWAGTVHHIAFRAKNEEEQLQLREKVVHLGLYPTEVIDRFYFRSVYFRTPAGILFEIATDGPGFIADEAETKLGEKLALPPFLESQRNAIEDQLPPLVSE